MSKLIKGLTVLAVLVSGAAFANPCNTSNGYHPATPVAVVAPPPPAGHYETRQVRTFIPGHWTFIQRNHHRVRVFNPSHYELVAQRVWVNGPAYPVAQIAPPPPVQAQLGLPGGVQLGLSING